jgi:serine/threonine-protein phosphatase 2A regulatory subunit B''
VRPKQPHTPIPLQLPKIHEGCVPVCAIAQYIRSKLVLHHLAGRLLSFDGTGDGCLREHELENYIFEAIPSVPDLAGLQENFFPFYVFTAVRKFFFFLDPNRTGRIRVRDLLASRPFAEWMALLPQGHPDLGPAGTPLPFSSSPHSRGGGGGGDSLMLLAERMVAEAWHVTSASPPGTNWFSAANALRVYSQYLMLDTDQNGMLNAHEFSAYRGGILTSACVSRIFEECHTYGGEIDYKVYLDVALALENRNSQSALKFLFKLLDISRCGKLRLPDLRHFCRDVCEKLAASGHEAVDVANVCDEIFDMVHPRNPAYITLDDIVRCGVGHTACGILLDAAAFFAYDRREELKGEQMMEDTPADRPYEG